MEGACHSALSYFLWKGGKTKLYGKYFTYDGEDSQTHALSIAGLEQGDDV